MTSVKFANQKTTNDSNRTSSADSLQTAGFESFQNEYELEEEEEDDAGGSFSMPNSEGEENLNRISVVDSDYDYRLKKKLQSLFDENSDDNSSDDDSYEGSSITYINQEALAEVPDFFAELGEVPDLDDISISPIVSEVIYKKSEAKLVTVVTDVGRFYNPLTGELLKSSSSEGEVKIGEEEILHYEAEEVEEEEDAGFLLLQYEIDSETELVQELTKQEEEQEEFFTKEQIGQLKEVIIDEDIDFEELQRQETARQVLYNTHEFLQQVIENVVQYCEDKTPILLLRQNLDKMKLMQVLNDKLDEMDSDEKVRQFLNRKAVEYFRRKKLFRAISEDNPETMAQDIAKLREATVQLDHRLGKEGELTRVSEIKISQLEGEHKQINMKASKAVENFDSLVRNTLRRENNDRWNASVDSNLVKMHKTRMEISKLRYRLIQKQHTLANLMYKLEKMEQLGGGLRMRDFERMNADTQALGRKIEERNAEWNKLILRRCSNLHIMAHMKERQTTMSQTISIQEVALQELRDEKQDVRQYLYNLKMERNRLRHEIRELSFQGGLLDKPALMQDYDETIERLTKMRVHVEHSLEKHTALTNRIQALELKTETSNDDVLYDSTSFI